MNDMGFLSQMWDDPQKRMLMTLGLNLLANSGQAPAGTTLGQRLGAAGMASMPMMGQLKSEMKAKQEEDIQNKMRTDLSNIFATGGDPSKVLSTISQSPELFKAIYPHMLQTQAAQAQAEAGARNKAPPGFGTYSNQTEGGDTRTWAHYWDTETNSPVVQEVTPTGPVSQKNPNLAFRRELANLDKQKTSASQEGQVIADVQKTAYQSVKHIKLVDAAIQQLDKGIISGKGADIFLGANKAKNVIIRAFGGEPSTNQAANTETFKSLIGQGLLDYMRQMAPVSNYDVENIQRWLGGDISLEGPAIREILRGFRDMTADELKITNERIRGHFSSIYPNDPKAVERNLIGLDVPGPKLRSKKPAMSLDDYLKSKGL